MNIVVLSGISIRTPSPLLCYVFHTNVFVDLLTKREVDSSHAHFPYKLIQMKKQDISIVENSWTFTLVWLMSWLHRRLAFLTFRSEVMFTSSIISYNIKAVMLQWTENTDLYYIWIKARALARTSQEVISRSHHSEFESRIVHRRCLLHIGLLYK
jgi:hypothetical protein